MNILFDLDGTLVDSAPDCSRFAPAIAASTFAAAARTPYASLSNAALVCSRHAAACPARIPERRRPRIGVPGWDDWRAE